MAPPRFARVRGLVLTAAPRWPLVVVAVLAAACLPRVPVQRLPTATPLAVAYVVDPSYSGEATTAPEQLKAAVNAVLAERNLEPREVPLEAVQGARLTDTRLSALKAAAGGAQYVLLVELRVQFFSQLDGRYRWEVGTALTAERPGGAQARDPFEVPIVLMFDHEKQPEAIVAAAPDIANRLGVLLDGLLASPGSAPRTLAPSRPHALYFAMVDRFFNGDQGNDGHVDANDPAEFHGGDLAGLTAKLGWLQSLGVDTVWVSPLAAMRAEKYHGYGAFHGYWPTSLTDLEPRFGTEAELTAFSREVHRRGMRWVLDVVLNHVGPDAPLVRERPSWFHHNGGITDWNSPNQLENFDVHGLPDLAQERPEVREALFAAVRRWLRARPT